MRIIFNLIILAVFGLCAPANAKNDVTIAVIDTGVSRTSFYENITNYDARDANNIHVAIEGDKASRIASDHGNWITSIIAQESPGSRILSYRVDEGCPHPNDCNMRTLNIYKSALHAVENGADIIVIASAGNMGEYGENKFAEIAAKGIHIVFAAGNGGKKSPMIRLASLNAQFIHVVGSITGYGKKSKFSSHDDGTGLFRWIEGEKVKVYGAKDKIEYVSGTSYSAAIYASKLVN